jgi:hypothetical protein
LVYIIKKPKAWISIFVIFSIIFAGLYFTLIQTQNQILLDAMKVISSMAGITETIQTKTKEVIKVSDAAITLIQERTEKLKEVEDRFQAKREEIQKLRTKQDVLLQELGDKLNTANEKLDQIDIQQKSLGMNPTDFQKGSKLLNNKKGPLIENEIK